MNKLHSSRGTFSALPVVKNKGRFSISSRKQGGKNIAVFDAERDEFRFLDKYTAIPNADLGELIIFGTHIINQTQKSQA